MGVNFNDSKLKPKYYTNNGKDLFDRFEEGLMTAEQNRGFYIGNVFKYITRYQNKNGVEDLQKASTYLNRLIAFETKANRTDSEKMTEFWANTFKNWQKAGDIRDSRTD
ncbi:DUF3310 domain-containing protein [Lactobacillus sp. LC28-10]|uniref:DUF3310 domain-containing protein n=2 Tax=Secundilactobacillus angelensis TaxID=2722706 RepID=A0ABX1KUS8_9LACO|nr:DUF3310 domain-containing protein [Secundilactobacillus angelensis]